MTLTQLRYFQTVCRLGNITQAARRLHVSQPSVSIAIRELEDEFGLMLLDRSGCAFSLTAELDRFRQEEITPNILIQTGRLSTVRELVTQGRAAGFLFSPIAASLPGVAGVPLAPPLTAQVSLVWNKGDYLSKPRAAFLDMARRLLLTKETTTAPYPRAGR